MKTLVTLVVATLLTGVASVCLSQDAGADKTPAPKDPAAKTPANAAESGKTPVQATVKTPTKLPTATAAARLRADIHRTMAELVLARAAEKPDEARIAQLSTQLETMRARLQYAAPLDSKAVAKLRAEIHRTMATLAMAEAAENPDLAKIERLRAELAAKRAKLWGPQGRGFAGPCPLGGPGLGPGQGVGPGYGRGQGQGFGRGPGYGRGMGYGRGQGYGRGMGYGRGQGFRGGGRR